MIAGDVNQSSIILYTWGYRGHKLSEIMPLMEQGATLVDIRFHPYSPAPQWRLWAFKKQFGDQYIWLGMLAQEIGVHLPARGQGRAREVRPLNHLQIAQR